MKTNINNAIRSLYQMIMEVNDQTLACNVVDYNKELRNISENIRSFDEFCECLYVNIHPEDREAFDRFTDPSYFPRELTDKVYASMECRIRQMNHQYYWSEIIFCHANQEDKVSGHDFLFLIQDINEWKTKELQWESEQLDMVREASDKYNDLFEENMKDEQTGCYNRKGLKYYTEIILDDAVNTGKYLFVCVADLNGLKYLNDTYGHSVGDEAIAAVSKELLSAAPKGTKIIRTGGDEFLLIAALSHDSTEPKEMEEKIDEGLKNYNENHNNEYTIGASYGWVLLPPRAGMNTLDEYVEMADFKMYDMKVMRDTHRRN